jgi:hypothetical protein
MSSTTTGAPNFHPQLRAWVGSSRILKILANALVTEPVGSIQDRTSNIECCLACLHIAVTIDENRTGWHFLLLSLLIGDSAWNYVCKKFKVVKSGYSICYLV